MDGARVPSPRLPAWSSDLRTFQVRLQPCDRASATVPLVRVAVFGLVALASTFARTGEARAIHVSGVRGTVMQGPTPVCHNDPCDEPASGVLIRFTRNSRVVAEVTTTRTGRYFVKLPAGSYVVTAPRRRIGKGLTPRVVRVHRGQVAAVDFHLDTGIQ